MLRVVIVDVLLELSVGKLIAIFKLAVVGTMLLDCVVSQMDECIVNVFQINLEF